MTEHDIIAAGAKLIGRRGGAKNTDAQKAARLRNAKLAGRPRRICAACGEPVYGGHKNPAKNLTCASQAWVWEKQSEKRAKAAATPRKKKVG